MRSNRVDALVQHLAPGLCGVGGLLLLGCSESKSSTPAWSDDEQTHESETISATTASESDEPAYDAGGSAASHSDAEPTNSGMTVVDGADGGSSSGNSEPTPALDSGSWHDNGRCVAPEGTGAPKTIAEVVDLINALPQPVDFECFLESLDRPLGIFSTSNVQSAQPAEGKRSPRIFLIMGDTLSMSFVPGATGTLEFGEIEDSGTWSVKGEVHFPIEAKLNLEDAFTRISFDSATKQSNCGVCHDNEERSVKYPFPTAFVNAVLDPQPFFAVDISLVRQEYDACNANEEPERCAMLQGLLGHGEVVQKAFP